MSYVSEYSLEECLKRFSFGLAGHGWVHGALYIEWGVRLLRRGRIRSCEIPDRCRLV